jgi:hypothetical protein
MKEITRDDRHSRSPFDVRPGLGIGPFQIGMTRDEARAAAEAASLSVRDFRRGGGVGPPDFFIAEQLFAYFEDGDTVTELEVALKGHRQVTCLDLDLGMPFRTVIQVMQAIAHLDETDPDPAGCTFPEIGLALWSESGPVKGGDRPVDAILVRTSEPYPLS